MATEVDTILGDYSYVWGRAMRSLFETFNNSSEGTLIVDRQARIVWINEKYAAHFGFADPKIAIGLDCEAVIPNSLMREVVETGKPILLDILETEHEPFVVTRLPLKDDSGAIIGAIGFALFGELKALTPLFSQYSRLQAELIATRHALAQTRRARYGLSNFVGTSPASMEVKRLARRAAQVDSPVLLLGETGTGKELIAHGIHAASARADKPFVAVNVAAIPDSLLEVELFGAAAGAYTGADRKGRIGKFELAHGGTLFLDEIGDMPLSLQSKLLRVLQEKEFEPLGTNRIVVSNARIIAATSVALAELVAARRFRADLYYRLNVLTIHTPPLRKRTHDIAALSDMILDELATHHHIDRPVLGEDALQRLREHAWPGNVRELRNTLERAVMFSDRPCITANVLAPFVGDDIDATLADPEFVRDPAAAHEMDIDGASYEDAMRRFEKRFLGAALRSEDGCVSKAAARIGIGRATLYKKMAVLGL
ncbi:MULTISPECIES: sigma-54-dependent Fis family transcriptional regulator [unclassified Burkholderia]|uniref:sigma-54 interaction domain-containing protein n=1 Tax=unclassified Burkholderia TaxID=2613784 RepID=UPI000F568F32|nr:MULTISPECIES: sigma 54-interacting transcriptional regulator [unclassified Burkholderia]RQR24083.1 AAA family ATPase [Burkholderia sp. Bp9142]RQR51537.1 AAA family ATPase [Burkholderia sp. Bp9140]